jgi:hypothetical protein
LIRHHSIAAAAAKAPLFPGHHVDSQKPAFETGLKHVHMNLTRRSYEHDMTNGETMWCNTAPQKGKNAEILAAEGDVTALKAKRLLVRLVAMSRNIVTDLRA